jgi:hypothetical protein
MGSVMGSELYAAHVNMRAGVERNIFAPLVLIIVNTHIEIGENTHSS